MSVYVKQCNLLCNLFKLFVLVSYCHLLWFSTVGHRQLVVKNGLRRGGNANDLHVYTCSKERVQDFLYVRLDDLMLLKVSVLLVTKACSGETDRSSSYTRL